MITILTPTYNRAYILTKLYESLKKQTSKKFEWIVIDDGSSDNTKEMVSSWISESNSFEIIYIKQKNGGKHRALNYGIKMASYEFCFIVDSDDYLTTNAISSIGSWLKTIDSNTFAGVSGLKGYIGGGNVGSYPNNKAYLKYIDATNLQRRKYNLSGDKAEVYKTKLLRDYPFPEFEGENFLTEEVVWDLIAKKGYKLRWFNEIIYRCEYNDDGLTKMGEKKFIENFEGYTYGTKQRMELHGKLSRQFAAGGYLSISKKKGLKVKQAAEKIGITLPEIMLANLLWHIKNCIKFVVKYKDINSKGKGES